MIEKNDTLFCRQTETDTLDTWIKVQKKSIAYVNHVVF